MLRGTPPYENRVHLSFTQISDSTPLMSLIRALFGTHSMLKKMKIKNNNFGMDILTTTMVQIINKWYSDKKLQQKTIPANI